jgi:hypothetical protein
MYRIGYWAIVGAVCVWSTASLVFASDGTLDLDEQGLLLLTGLGLAVVWVIRLGDNRVSRGTREVVWVALPVFATGAMVVATGTHLPLSSRLWLCEDSLRDYVETAEPTPQYTRSVRRVGFFSVTGVRREGQTVLLQTCHDGFASVGIAYSPDAAPSYSPRKEVHAMFTHLYGPWYRYEFPDKGGFQTS